MRYIKNPEIVEAFQYIGELTCKEGNLIVPIWVIECIVKSDMFFDNERLRVRTPNGVICVEDYDYVIKKEDGTLETYDAGIFEKTYAPYGRKKTEE